MSSLHISSLTTLLVIDIQERLLSAMPEARAEEVLKQTATLIALADEVGATILYTEQYPRGLGHTERTLREALEGAQASRVEKVHFDACEAPEFQEHLDALGRRVIVCGMEAHICVLATAQSLLSHGKEVLVPFDAVCSRDARYEENGLAMMTRAGAVVTNTESLVFGALGSSKHEEFKRFSKRIQ